MKNSLLSLGSVLFLAACSGGGGGNNGTGLPQKPGSDINPLAKPSNPAPLSYIQSLMKLTANSDQYIPEETAVFPEVFYGDYVSKIEEGGESQKQALARLNSEGLKFRDRIKANCLITPVTVVESSKTSQPAKKGEVSAKTLVMSSSGNRCEYLLSKSGNVEKTYLADEGYDAETRTSTTKTSQVEVESENLEIRNTQIVSAAGTKSRKSVTTTESQSESSYAPNASLYKYLRKSSGTFETTLSNGAVLKGTTQSYSASTQSREEGGTENYESESISQNRISTPRGDVWVTFVSKGRDSFELYINGQKLSPEEAAKIGFRIKN